MHAAIFIPQFPIQAVLSASDLRRDTPIALLDAPAVSGKDKDIVQHINDDASRAGVQSGMTATQAQARCPQISFIHRDEAAEKSAQKKLLECAELWSPDYESTRPGFCVFDLTHVKPVLGREDSCGISIHQHLGGQQLEAKIGFASNPDLAVLAAQAAAPVLILQSDADARRFLHALPIAAMRPSKELHRVLTLWGVRTLGAFVQLPRQDVAARLGHEGLLLWDMASGGHERMLKLVRPPTTYREELELEHAVESLEPLLFIFRRMLQGLVEKLGDAWLVAASVQLKLCFADGASHQHELRVAEPSGDMELLFRLLHTHLESFTAAAPITFVALELMPTRAVGNQAHLFERTLRDPNRFAETMAQLEALVGAERVGRARLLPSRRTDAFAMEGFFEKASSGQSASPNATAHGLPLRRFRPSRQASVTVVDEMPSAFYSGNESHALIASEGPWLLSGDWWDAATAWQKEVWLVETSEGCLYQIAKEQGAWTVEGVVG